MKKVIVISVASIILLYSLAVIAPGTLGFGIGFTAGVLVIVLPPTLIGLSFIWAIRRFVRR